MSWPTDSLPILLALGWVVRVPGISREEGHEAIMREACEGLPLSPEQQQALIRGVRAPDVGLAGFLVSALPFAQRRHALRGWSGMTTKDGIQEMRDFITARHFRALGLPEGAPRWATFGEVLHCLQDSYSPAHADRVGGRIVYMKHWGPMDGLRRARPGSAPADEHGFPSDRRDSAWSDGALTEEARAAVEASRRYLEMASRHSAAPPNQDSGRDELDAFLGGVGLN